MSDRAGEVTDEPVGDSGLRTVRARLEEAAAAVPEERPRLLAAVNDAIVEELARMDAELDAS